MIKDVLKKALNNLASYKLWIWVVTVFMLRDYLEAWHIFAITMVVLGARGVADAITAKMGGAPPAEGEGE